MKATEEFLKYVDQFNNKDEKILLKRKHTLRVVKLCEEIANSLKLTQEEVDLAKLCGLLHDIGRFNQIKEYDTYNDLTSLDHGDLGEVILKKNKFINNFTNKNQDTILRAVKYHNKYSVPKTINEKNRLFVNITRDADKIDILYLFINKEIYTQKEYTSISKKVYKNLMDKKQIRNKDVKTSADNIAILFAFIFDINFKKSFEIIKEKDYINKMINIQIKRTENEEFINQLKEIQVLVNNYIEEMIQC